MPPSPARHYDAMERLIFAQRATRYAVRARQRFVPSSRARCPSHHDDGASPVRYFRRHAPAAPPSPRVKWGSIVAHIVYRKTIVQERYRGVDVNEFAKLRSAACWRNRLLEVIQINTPRSVRHQWLSSQRVIGSVPRWCEARRRAAYAREVVKVALTACLPSCHPPSLHPLIASQFHVQPSRGVARQCRKRLRHEADAQRVRQS